MVEEAKEIYEKGKEAFEAGYSVGQKIDEATGASDKWSSAAVDADPERARAAADAWDRGDHLEAVGDFIVGSGEALVGAITDAFSGPEASVPDVHIESPAEEVTMSYSSVSHDDPPPPER